MHVLAVITARGGSKNVPRKNIQPLGELPLLAYTIRHAQASRRVTRTILTTDDPEIAAVGRAHGVEVPFLRPAELARDETPDLPVFDHALAWLREHERYSPDVVIHLRPTSPGRTAPMLDEAVDLLLAHPEATCVRGVARPRDNPFKMWTIDASGYLHPLLTLPGVEEPYNCPRQSLPEVWFQLGYVDVIRTSTILEDRSMTGKRILALRLPVKEYIDVDSAFDLRVAELLLERWRQAWRGDR